MNEYFELNDKDLLNLIVQVGAKADDQVAKLTFSTLKASKALQSSNLPLRLWKEQSFQSRISMGAQSRPHKWRYPLLGELDSISVTPSTSIFLQLPIQRF